MDLVQPMVAGLQFEQISKSLDRLELEVRSYLGFEIANGNACDVYVWDQIP